MDISKFNQEQKEAYFQFLLQLGDNHLIIGHRLSEWCGYGPILEEDIAMTNLSLDHIGHANAFLTLAGKVEGKGRSADDLAYFREAVEFKNHQLVEKANHDFARTMMREYLFSVYCDLFYRKLVNWGQNELSDILGKAIVENSYHLKHSESWILRLGDGTSTSHLKAQEALDFLYPFATDLYSLDMNHSQMDQLLINELSLPNKNELKPIMQQKTSELFSKATLKVPDGEKNSYQFKALYADHSEELGHILAEMQIVARSYPGARW